MSETGRSRGALVAGLALAGAGVIGAGAWTVLTLVRSGAPSPTRAAPAGPAATPQTVQELLDASRAYMNQDKAAGAEAILKPAVERIPESQSLRLLYAECLLQQDRFEEAYDSYTQGIFIGPDHPEYRFVAGTIASRLGRLEDAEAHYAMAQSLDRSNPKFPLYLAQVQRKRGKVDDARANLVIATGLDPNLAVAWATLAAIALDENRLDVARGYVEKARAIEPERADFRVVEAKILRRAGDPSAALGVLLAVSETERAGDPGVALELSLCYGMLGRVSEAARVYVDAVAANPDDAELCYQAAVWLEKDGQRGRAETYALHAAAKGHEAAKRLVEAWDR